MSGRITRLETMIYFAQSEDDGSNWTTQILSENTSNSTNPRMAVNAQTFMLCGRIRLQEIIRCILNNPKMAALNGRSKDSSKDSQKIWVTQ